MNIRQIAITTATILGTLALVYLLFEFHQALILFLFSLAVAAATRPYVEKLASRGMPRTRALLLVYGVFVAFLSLLFYAVGSQLMQELGLLADSLAQAYDRIWAQWPQGTEFQRLIARQLPAPADLYARFSLDQENSVLPGLLGLTMTWANFLGQFVTVLILSLYWSIDRVHFERLWLSLLPVESRAVSRDIWRDIERDFGAYVRSEVLQSIVAAILLGVGLWAMGIQYPVLLALFAAVAWLIPWLGGVLVIVPVALAGFAQSQGLGIFAVAYASGVLFFLEFYIEPRFIRRQQFSSLLSILLILALIEPFGLLGVIVAPPLAAAIQLVFRYNLQPRPVSEAKREVEQFGQLRARLLMLRQLTGASKEPVEPHTLNLLERLEILVDEADDALSERRRQRGQGARRASVSQAESGWPGD